MKGVEADGEVLGEERGVQGIEEGKERGEGRRRRNC
jgi:hypothetical protein